LSSIPHDKTVV